MRPTIHLTATDRSSSSRRRSRSTEVAVVGRRGVAAVVLLVVEAGGRAIHTMYACRFLHFKYRFIYVFRICVSLHFLSWVGAVLLSGRHPAVLHTRICAGPLSKVGLLWCADKKPTAVRQHWHRKHSAADRQLIGLVGSQYRDEGCWMDRAHSKHVKNRS